MSETGETWHLTGRIIDLIQGPMQFVQDINTTINIKTVENFRVRVLLSLHSDLHNLPGREHVLMIAVEWMLAV